MLLPLLLACSPEPTPPEPAPPEPAPLEPAPPEPAPPEPAPPEPPAAPASAPPGPQPAASPVPANGAAHAIELVLDRGHFEDAEWLSEPTTDSLVAPTAQQVGDRAFALLPDGDHAAVIQRACGQVHVAFSVKADTAIVSLPYPRCGTAAPDGIWTGADLASLHALGLLADWPPSPPTSPAAWASSADAHAACTWYGMALPTAPPTGLPAPTNGVATWLTGDRVVGDDWTVPTVIPAVARDHRVGVACVETGGT